MSRRFKAALWIAFSISLIVWGFLFIRWRMGHESPHYARWRRASCYTFMGQLEQALSMYRIEHGEYPTPESGGLALLNKKSPKYGCIFEFKPGQIDSSGRVLDCWGHPIIYRLRRDPPGVYLCSFGPNGEDDGGKGDDISNED